MFYSLKLTKRLSSPRFRVHTVRIIRLMVKNNFERWTVPACQRIRRIRQAWLWRLGERVDARGPVLTYCIQPRTRTTRTADKTERTGPATKRHGFSKSNAKPRFEVLFPLKPRGRGWQGSRSDGGWLVASGWMWFRVQVG